MEWKPRCSLRFLGHRDRILLESIVSQSLFRADLPKSFLFRAGNCLSQCSYHDQSTWEEGLHFCSQLSAPVTEGSQGRNIKQVTNLEAGADAEALEDAPYRLASHSLHDHLLLGDTA